MSFSQKVKEELSRQLPAARHCRLAEMAAIISMCGRVCVSGKNEYFIKIHTENLTVARKYFMLIRKTFHCAVEISVRGNATQKKGMLYTLVIGDPVQSLKILQAVKLLDEDGEIQGRTSGEKLPSVNNLIIQSTCCKRAFIRGAFLSAGSISNPEKAYHFEIVTPARPKAVQLQQIICSFGIDAKIVQRKKYFVVYVKEGEQLVDLLNIMEAHVALMDLENVRIVKEMRNSINRQVNCEAANINKTVQAAGKQIDDIWYIKNSAGFGNLSEGLREIAVLRIEQPDASLKELGALLNPPISKSGVNHRLRKLSMIADTIRQQKEDVGNGDKKHYD
ncbi:DNA-binding protein WhiA [Anaerolentibacter hominis]|uniref:DNA-binding protein WhiA n=1 Tax=Anaerolentibacter hominis TaxID=3079009 RepID=UPI0031B88E60